MTPSSIPAAELSILIIDDDEEVKKSLSMVLESLGHNVVGVANGEDGIRLIEKNSFDLVLCDFKLPGLSGLDLLKRCGAKVPIIIMTAYGNTAIVTDAVIHGAYDYLSKPLVPDELLFCLRKFEERERLRRENASLRESLSDTYSFGSIVAKSEAFKEIFETVKRLSQFTTTTLITGESGTGKELLARAIHENSPRKGKPFIAINCGAIPESLMESELFGHKKGAFTDAAKDKRGLFEEANGGTLFLDEIGELPLHLQVKLLRSLQERAIRRVGDEELISIDIRLISATLRNLESDVKSGRFREDLFYRLNVVSIHLPPLRDRKEDIPLLVTHFMQKHTKRLALPSKRIPPEILKILLEYPWKGNARELENCIERAIVLSVGDTIEREALPEAILQPPPLPMRAEISGKTSTDESSLSIKQRSRDLEVDLIQRALKKTGGNRTHAAKVLEISHRALLYKLKEYGIGES